MILHAQILEQQSNAISQQQQQISYQNQQADGSVKMGNFGQTNDLANQKGSSAMQRQPVQKVQNQAMPQGSAQPKIPNMGGQFMQTAPMMDQQSNMAKQIPQANYGGYMQQNPYGMMQNQQQKPAVSQQIPQMNQQQLMQQGYNANAYPMYRGGYGATTQPMYPQQHMQQQPQQQQQQQQKPFQNMQQQQQMYSNMMGDKQYNSLGRYF